MLRCNISQRKLASSFVACREMKRKVVKPTDEGYRASGFSATVHIVLISWAAL